MRSHYTDKPVGKLPRATGLGDITLKLGKRTIEYLLEQHSILGWFHKRAVANPGVMQFRYLEENGYEYEEHTVYDRKTNTLTTNVIPCPIYYNHHIGDTCRMCGMKD